MSMIIRKNDPQHECLQSLIEHYEGAPIGVERMRSGDFKVTPLVAKSTGKRFSPSLVLQILNEMEARRKAKRERDQRRRLHRQEKREAR